MTETGPYIIQHIQLEYISEKNLMLPAGKLYLVFWWKKIPLGSVFTEQRTQLTQSELHEIIPDIIAPAIDAYALNNPGTGTYKKAFTDKDYLLFTSIMDDIFSGYHTQKYPEKVDISVVICTRNRSAELQTCIDSLLNQVSVPREILVIDNAPADDSTMKVAGKYESVTYYREVRAGLDIARNTGARKASYPVVAYADDDVQVHPDWSYRIWETFQDPSVGAMTGLVIASKLDTESQQIFEKHWEFNKGYQDKIFDTSFLQTKAPRVWEIGAGANMAFRKDVLEKIDYFDERLDVGAAGCSGDSEIWYRILSAGYTIKYNPRAVSYHAHRKELSALHKQLFNYMRGHAAAALIQHAQNEERGYKKYLYYDLPKYYLFLIRAGFPGYSSRYKTLWSEIKGVISGIRFFHKFKNSPAITRFEQQ